MEKSNPPGIAALGAMTDTLDFVKKMWGNMGVPGMAVPTLSIDEVNKKIADLKAVESWLSLNMNMLRGTIQALEVQSGTIAALQSMSAAIGVPGTQGESKAEPPVPFESPFAAPVQEASPPPARPPFEFTHRSAPEPESTVSTPDLSAAPVNPVAWWNVLQEQFQQAVSNAVSQSAIHPPTSAAPAAKTKPAKPAAARKRKPS